MSTSLPVLKATDFASDQDIRWCPGCGDYSILAQMKKMLPSLGLPLEEIVFISGIGCSSRFPYYMNTYGIHSIHGRAPAFATGLRVARPDLKVFVITGDGDSLSIGGNHFVHLLRRNVDVTLVLFNNRIYGLTKGQYSPTSPEGQVTKSTPMGSVDHPLNPISIALGAEAGFIARSVDSNIKHLGETLYRAAQHRGTSVVEVYQNCNVFNDGAFSYAQDKATRSDTTVELEHGKPMIFGANRDKGIRLNGFSPEVVDLNNGGVSQDDLLFHDEQADSTLVHILAKMRHPDFPEPIGVFRAVEAEIFEDGVRGQVEAAVEKKGAGDLNKLFSSGDTWNVA
jgi:2-oxoglutarate ferredoxin oxidoreductase subunit beta